MTVWDDRGLDEPPLDSDGAPDAVDALEYLLTGTPFTEDLSAAQPGPWQITSVHDGDVDPSEWLTWSVYGGEAEDDEDLDPLTNHVPGGASRQGYWPSMISIVNDDPDRIQSVGLTIENILRRNPGIHATPDEPILHTGLHIKSFIPPDNGGDNSGILSLSTGGASAISTYKVSRLRPEGWEDYVDSQQGALEAGCDDNSFAILAMAGSHVGGNICHAIWARLDDVESKGILISPGAANPDFDLRPALAIGTQAFGDPEDDNLHFLVSLSGAVRIYNSINFRNYSDPWGDESVWVERNVGTAMEFAWNAAPAFVPFTVLRMHPTGPVELPNAGAALILRSPNNARWNITVSNDGEFVVNAA